jgi:hypothetical protein
MDVVCTRYIPINTNRIFAIQVTSRITDAQQLTITLPITGPMERPTSIVRTKHVKHVAVLRSA